MKVYELAQKMLAEAQTMLPPNTANSFFWIIGVEVREAIVSEFTTIRIENRSELIQRQVRCWDGDIQFCGLPAFVKEGDPNSIRLMMAMQVKAEVVELPPLEKW